MLKSLLTFIFLCAFPLTASAQETSGSFAGGSVKVGNDTRTCDSTTEGNIRYTTADAMEYCDGSDWINVTSGGIGGGAGNTGGSSTGASGTPCTIGDAVGDGICAGEWQGYDLIAAPAGCNAGDTSAGDCDGTDDTDTWGFNGWGDLDNSYLDMVQANADYFAECAGGCSGKIPDNCANLALDGYNWYVPTMPQLQILYANKDTGSWTGGGFTNTNYASINIYSANSMIGLDFTDGDNNELNSDFGSWAFRCVRLQSRAASCVAPSDCSNVGDTCTDGSEFVGFLTYDGSCEAVFMTAADQSTSQAHSSETLDNTGAESDFDGRANQAWIVANRTLSNYPAFQTCENLTDHSKSDWYLPAKFELIEIGANSSNNGLVTGQRYNTSTQGSSSSAWNVQVQGSLAVGQFSKSSSLRTRCIRRD